MSSSEKYDPLKTRNQHYVPQFWQRRFSAEEGGVWTLRDKQVRKRSPKGLMSRDWLYTTFDAGGRPSNVLERWSSRIEGQAAAAMSSLDVPDGVGTEEEQIFLRWFVAFSACRHPDTLRAAHARVKQLAISIVDAFNKSLEDYQLTLSKFGIEDEDAEAIFNHIRSLDEAELIDEMDDVITRPPNDAILPSQLAIDPETIERVFFGLAQHEVTVLEAPDGESFVLGDTPFPPNIGMGFTLPISRKIALRWEPAQGESFPGWTRRLATSSEVDESNRTQADNALRDLIAGSKEDLEPFKT